MKRKILNYFFLLKVLFISSFVKPKDKKVYIDIRDITLNRYLFNFMKFFVLMDYTVYLPNDSSIIGKMSINSKKGELKYAAMILKEKIKIGKPSKKSNALWITKEQLSNDFFNSKYYDNKLYYHVPMSKYPLMYNSEYLSINTDFKTNRKKSGFMSGNFDEKRYEEITKSNYFDIPNRREIFNYINAQSYNKKIKSQEEFVDFLKSDEDSAVVLINAQDDFRLSFYELLKSLEKFSFFIALPGVVMPQSHNLMEAIGVGCIPIIHETYANLFVPPLVNNETALVYKNKNELNDLLVQCFAMSQEDILILRKKVVDYYDLYLSPSSIVEKIVNSKFDKIFIQAEHISLNLLENKNI
ncbi:hypothetical protein [Flavobacterium sp. 245]|uniref:hypothetical protein n=1 Tax=Flavobacterium sp. 245 TaxID=2512115 RepID=UPI0010616B1C|nr:hypothetical protein [Flavobacterium sp. 245]